jgi:hypothetical protein
LGDLVEKLRSGPGNAHAEEILELAYEYGDAYPGGETYGHRIGDKLNDTAQARNGHEDQQKTGYEGGQLESRHAMNGDDVGDDHHEGTGRPGDLVEAAAEKRDDKTGDNSRVQALGGARPGSYGKSHGQGQGDDAHGYACGQVLAEIFFSVTPRKGLEKSRSELGEKRLNR